MPDNSDFNNFDVSQPYTSDPAFSEPPMTASNDFAQTYNASQPPTYGSNLAPAPAPSTDLVRRARNQQLAPQNGQHQLQEQWNGSGGGGSASLGNTNGQPEVEDEQELDMKVQMAKRDAQGKRKQIPPFVQKLSR